jgi:hypothetical protein
MVYTPPGITYPQSKYADSYAKRSTSSGSAGGSFLGTHTSATPTGETAEQRAARLRAEEEARLRAEEEARRRAEEEARRRAEGGESSTPSDVVGYTAPATRASANISIPDLSWNPTSEQLANWLLLGGQQAETEAAPQRTSLTTGLERYTNQAGEAQTAANKQYTDQELSLANIVKNTVLKSIEENAIRRNATESGWLGGQQKEAGRYETEQRAGIKNTANDYFNQLSNAVLEKTNETNDLLTELERVKGLRTNVLANQLQGTERSNVFQEKNQTFQNEYARGSMINSEEAQAALNAYNNAALAAQIESTNWQQNFAEEEFAANQAQQNWQNNYATSSAKSVPTAAKVPLGSINGVPYYGANDYATLYNAVNKNSSGARLTLDQIKAQGGTILDYLMQ